MSWLPLLIVPLAAYSLIAPFGMDMSAPLIGIMSFEDLLVAMALILVAIEIWRATAATPQTARHLVASLILLLLVVIEWFLPWSRTGTFALLTLLTGVNLVVSGYVAFVMRGEHNIWVNR